MTSEIFTTNKPHAAEFDLSKTTAKSVDNAILIRFHLLFNLVI